jgi:hypothetical protein
MGMASGLRKKKNCHPRIEVESFSTEMSCLLVLSLGFRVLGFGFRV